MGNALTVGWVISDQLNRKPWVRESVLTGGGVGLARYLWLAQYVNKHRVNGVRYEVYRPWRHYKAVIFLKSMGERAHSLLNVLQDRHVPCVFDANVNYFETGGAEYYQHMLPTERQQEEACQMARSADAVIADSGFIAERCREYNRHVAWVPDNVNMDVVPDIRHGQGERGPLRLLWSGESVKLFEFLAIESVLRKFSPRIELVLVTNFNKGVDRIFPEYRERLYSLLDAVPHRIIDFSSISQLFEIYSEGGVLVSPRFLDSPYNHGHTEWKITLGMACGRFALCSPVPSYLDVAERAGGSGIRICRQDEDWESALESILSAQIDMEQEEAGARSVVEKHYSTSVVAGKHSEIMREIVARGSGSGAIPAGLDGQSSHAIAMGDRR